MTDQDRPPRLSALAILAGLIGLLLLLASTLWTIALLGLGAGLGAANGIVGATQVWALIGLSILSVGSVLYLVFAVGVFASSPTTWWAGVLGALATLASAALLVVIGGGTEPVSLAASMIFAVVLSYALIRDPRIRAHLGRD